MLHADYCAQYEYTSKILMSRGKNIVPLYIVQFYTKKLKKGVPMNVWTAVSTKCYHNRLLINCVSLTYCSVCVLSF